MAKYAKLMKRLEIINVEFFKGICQLFGKIFHFVFESFGHQKTNLNFPWKQSKPLIENVRTTHTILLMQIRYLTLVVPTIGLFIQEGLSHVADDEWLSHS